MIKKIATKLDSRAVFLFLSSCHLASVAFGGDSGIFDIESALDRVKHNPQMNEGKSRELDQSPPMHDPEHIKRFRKSIFDICTKYLDSITEQDVIETWAVFFTLLEKNESNKKDKKNIYLKVNEIEKILNDLPKKNQYEEDSKKRLIDWHQNYTENNALGPNLSLSSKALRLKMMYQTIQPSL